MPVRIHPTADISPLAQIGDGTSIWHHAQISEGAQIGKNCIISKGVYIDAGEEIVNTTCQTCSRQRDIPRQIWERVK